MEGDELICRVFKQEFRKQILHYSDNVDGQLFSYGAALSVFAKCLNNNPTSQQIGNTWDELMRSVVLSLLNPAQRPSEAALQKFDTMLQPWLTNESVISEIRDNIRVLHQLAANGAWDLPPLQSLLKGELVDPDELADILDKENPLVAVIRLQILHLNAQGRSSWSLINVALSKEKYKKSKMFQKAFQTHAVYCEGEKDLLPLCADFDFKATLEVVDKFKTDGDTHKMKLLCDTVMTYMWKTDTVTMATEMTSKWCEIQLAETKYSADFASFVKSRLLSASGPTTVTHCLILMQTIWEMVGESCRFLCVDILMRALHFLKKEEDQDNQEKIRILETISRLLPASAVSRLCTISVFFLEPCIETYFMVADAFKVELDVEKEKRRVELKTELAIYISDQFPSANQLNLTEWSCVKEECFSRLSEDDITLIQQEEIRKSRHGSTSDTTASGDTSSSSVGSASPLVSDVMVAEEKEKFSEETPPKISKSQEKDAPKKRKKAKKKKFGWTCPVDDCKVISGRMSYLRNHLKVKHSWDQEEISAFTKSLGVSKTAVWTATSDNFVALSEGDPGILTEDDKSLSPGSVDELHHVPSAACTESRDEEEQKVDRNPPPEAMDAPNVEENSDVSSVNQERMPEKGASEDPDLPNSTAGHAHLDNRVNVSHPAASCMDSAEVSPASKQSESKAVAESENLHPVIEQEIKPTPASQDSVLHVDSSPKTEYESQEVPPKPPPDPQADVHCTSDMRNGESPDTKKEDISSNARKDSTSSDRRPPAKKHSHQRRKSADQKSKDPNKTLTERKRIKSSDQALESAFTSVSLKPDRNDQQKNNVQHSQKKKHKHKKDRKTLDSVEKDAERIVKDSPSPATTEKAEKKSKTSTADKQPKPQDEHNVKKVQSKKSAEKAKLPSAVNADNKKMHPHPSKKASATSEAPASSNAATPKAKTSPEPKTVLIKNSSVPVLHPVYSSAKVTVSVKKSLDHAPGPLDKGHPGYLCPADGCDRVFIHKHTIIAHLKFRHHSSQSDAERMSENAKEAVKEETPAIKEEKRASPPPSTENKIICSRGWYMKVDTYIHESEEQDVTLSAGKPGVRNCLVECLRRLFRFPLTNFNYNSASKYILSSWPSLDESTTGLQNKADFPDVFEPMQVKSTEKPQEGNPSVSGRNRVTDGRKDSESERPSTPINDDPVSSDSESDAVKHYTSVEKAHRSVQTRGAGDQNRSASDYEIASSYQVRAKRITFDRSKHNPSPTVMSGLAFGKTPTRTIAVQASKSDAASGKHQPPTTSKTQQKVADHTQNPQEAAGSSKDKFKKPRSHSTSGFASKSENLLTSPATKKSSDKVKRTTVKDPPTPSVDAKKNPPKPPPKGISFEEALIDPNRVKQEKSRHHCGEYKVEKLSSTTTLAEAKQKRSISLDANPNEPREPKMRKSLQPTEHGGLGRNDRRERHGDRTKPKKSHRKYGSDTQAANSARPEEREEDVPAMEDYQDLLKRAEEVSNNRPSLPGTLKPKRPRLEAESPSTSLNVKQPHLPGKHDSKPGNIVKKPRVKPKRSIDLRKLSSVSPEDESTSDTLKRRLSNQSNDRNNPLDTLLSETVLAESDSSSSFDHTNAGNHEASASHKCNICGKQMTSGFALTCHMRKRHKVKAKMFIPDTNDNVPSTGGREADSGHKPKKRKNSSDQSRNETAGQGKAEKMKQPKNDEPVHAESGDAARAQAGVNSVEIGHPEHQTINDDLTDNFFKVFYSASYRENVQDKRDLFSQPHITGKVLYDSLFRFDTKQRCPYPSCSATLSNRRSLIRHAQTVHHYDLAAVLQYTASILSEDGLNRCFTCKTAFDDLTKLEAHVEESAECRYMPVLLTTAPVLNSEASLNMKLKDATQLGLTCFMCQKVGFSSFRSVLDHIRAIHHVSRKTLAKNGGMEKVREQALLAISRLSKGPLHDEQYDADNEEGKDTPIVTEDTHHLESASVIGSESSAVFGAGESPTTDTLGSKSATPPQGTPSSEHEVLRTSPRPHWVDEEASNQSDSFYSCEDSQDDIHPVNLIRHAGCKSRTSHGGQSSAEAHDDSRGDASTLRLNKEVASVKEDEFTSSTDTQNDSFSSQEESATKSPAAATHLRRLAYTQAARKIAMKTPEDFNRRRWAEFQNLSYLYNKRALKKVALALEPAPRMATSSSGSLPSTSAATHVPSASSGQNLPKICWLCKDTFRKQNNYISHIMHHLRSIDRYENRCDSPGCLYGFKTTEGLEKHRALHRNGRYVCLFCCDTPEVFQTHSELIRHENRCHSSVHSTLQRLRNSCITSFPKTEHRSWQLSTEAACDSDSGAYCSSDHSNTEHFLGCSHRKRHRTRSEHCHCEDWEIEDDVCRCETDAADAPCTERSELVRQCSVCDIVADILDTIDEAETMDSVPRAYEKFNAPIVKVTLTRCDSVMSPGSRVYVSSPTKSSSKLAETWKMPETPCHDTADVTSDFEPQQGEEELPAVGCEGPQQNFQNSESDYDEPPANETLSNEPVDCMNDENGEILTNEDAKVEVETLVEVQQNIRDFEDCSGFDELPVTTTLPNRPVERSLDDDDGSEGYELCISDEDELLDRKRRLDEFDATPDCLDSPAYSRSGTSEAVLSETKPQTCVVLSGNPSEGPEDKTVCSDEALDGDTPPVMIVNLGDVGSANDEKSDNEQFIGESADVICGNEVASTNAIDQEGCTKYPNEPCMAVATLAQVNAEESANTLVDVHSLMVPLEGCFSDLLGAAMQPPADRDLDEEDLLLMESAYVLEQILTNVECNEQIEKFSEMGVEKFAGWISVSDEHYQGVRCCVLVDEEDLPRTDTTTSSSGSVDAERVEPLMQSHTTVTVIDEDEREVETDLIPSTESSNADADKCSQPTPAEHALIPRNQNLALVESRKRDADSTDTPEYVYCFSPFFNSRNTFMPVPKVRGETDLIITVHEDSHVSTPQGFSVPAIEWKVDTPAIVPVVPKLKSAEGKIALDPVETPLHVPQNNISQEQFSSGFSCEKSIPVKQAYKSIFEQSKRKPCDSSEDLFMDSVYDSIRFSSENAKKGRPKKMKLEKVLKDPFRKFRGRMSRHAMEIDYTELPDEWHTDESIYLKMFPSMAKLASSIGGGKKAKKPARPKNVKRSKSLDAAKPLFPATISAADAAVLLRSPMKNMPDASLVPRVEKLQMRDFDGGTSGKPRQRSTSESTMQLARPLSVVPSTESPSPAPAFSKASTVKARKLKRTLSETATSSGKSRKQSFSATSAFSNARHVVRHVVNPPQLDWGRQQKTVSGIVRAGLARRPDEKNNIMVLGRSLLREWIPCGTCLQKVIAEDLLEHMLAHVLHPLNLFACHFLGNKCFFRCKTREELFVHGMRHTGVNQFLCMFCPETFCTDADVEKHRSTKHRLFRDLFFKELHARQKSIMSTLNEKPQLQTMQKQPQQPSTYHVTIPRFSRGSIIRRMTTTTKSQHVAVQSHPPSLMSFTSPGQAASHAQIPSMSTFLRPQYPAYHSVKRANSHDPSTTHSAQASNIVATIRKSYFGPVPPVVSAGQPAIFATTKVRKTESASGEVIVIDLGNEDTDEEEVKNGPPPLKKFKPKRRRPNEGSEALTGFSVEKPTAALRVDGNVISVSTSTQFGVEAVSQSGLSTEAIEQPAVIRSESCNSEESDAASSNGHLQKEASTAPAIPFTPVQSSEVIVKNVPLPPDTSTKIPASSQLGEIVEASTVVGGCSAQEENTVKDDLPQTPAVKNAENRAVLCEASSHADKPSQITEGVAAQSESFTHEASSSVLHTLADVCSSAAKLAEVKEDCALAKVDATEADDKQLTEIPGGESEGDSMPTPNQGTSVADIPELSNDRGQKDDPVTALYTSKQDGLMPRKDQGHNCDSVTTQEASKTTSDLNPHCSSQQKAAEVGKAAPGKSPRVKHCNKIRVRPSVFKGGCDIERVRCNVPTTRSAVPPSDVAPPREHATEKKDVLIDAIQEIESDGISTQKIVNEILLPTVGESDASADEVASDEALDDYSAHKMVTDAECDVSAVAKVTLADCSGIKVNSSVSGGNTRDHAKLHGLGSQNSGEMKKVGESSSIDSQSVSVQIPTFQDGVDATRSNQIVCEEVGTVLPKPEHFVPAIAPTPPLPNFQCAQSAAASPIYTSSRSQSHVQLSSSFQRSPEKEMQKSQLVLPSLFAKGAGQRGIVRVGIVGGSRTFHIPIPSENSKAEMTNFGLGNDGKIPCGEFQQQSRVKINLPGFSHPVTSSTCPNLEAERQTHLYDTKDDVISAQIFPSASDHEPVNETLRSLSDYAGHCIRSVSFVTGRQAGTNTTFSNFSRQGQTGRTKPIASQTVRLLQPLSFATGNGHGVERPIHRFPRVTVSRNVQAVSQSSFSRPSAYSQNTGAFFPFPVSGRRSSPTAASSCSPFARRSTVPMFVTVPTATVAGSTPMLYRIKQQVARKVQVVRPVVRSVAAAQGRANVHQNATQAHRVRQPSMINQSTPTTSSYRSRTGARTIALSYMHNRSPNAYATTPPPSSITNFDRSANVNSVGSVLFRRANSHASSSSTIRHHQTLARPTVERRNDSDTSVPTRRDSHHGATNASSAHVSNDSAQGDVNSVVNIFIDDDSEGKQSQDRSLSPVELEDDEDSCDEDDFPCHECGLCFLEEDDLEEHLEEVHMGIRCYFPRCRASYESSTELEDHLKRCHNITVRESPAQDNGFMDKQLEDAIWEDGNTYTDKYRYRNCGTPRYLFSNTVDSTEAAFDVFEDLKSYCIRKKFDSMKKSSRLPIRLAGKIHILSCPMSTCGFLCSERPIFYKHFFTHHSVCQLLGFLRGRYKKMEHMRRKRNTQIVRCRFHGCSHVFLHKRTEGRRLDGERRRHMLQHVRHCLRMVRYGGSLVPIFKSKVHLDSVVGPKCAGKVFSSSDRLENDLRKPSDEVEDEDVRVVTEDSDSESVSSLKSASSLPARLHLPGHFATRDFLPEKKSAVGRMRVTSVLTKPVDDLLRRTGTDPGPSLTRFLLSQRGVEASSHCKTRHLSLNDHPAKLPLVMLEKLECDV